MPLSTIASITYNADGSIADVDARLVGDRAELIAGAIKQLSILLPDDDADAVAVRAAADVDSLLSTAEPVEAPSAAEEGTEAPAPSQPATEPSSAAPTETEA